jgi:hypothetical protein
MHKEQTDPVRLVLAQSAPSFLLEQIWSIPMRNKKADYGFLMSFELAPTLAPSAI